MNINDEQSVLNSPCFCDSWRMNFAGIPYSARFLIFFGEYHQTQANIDNYWNVYGSQMLFILVMHNKYLLFKGFN